MGAAHEAGRRQRIEASASTAAAPPYLIDAHDLARHFGPIQAVAGISLRVAAGEVLALLGPNGAGKTTTMQMLAGLLPPSHGRATVVGYDVTRDAARVRARVGLTVDEPGFYPEMTVGEYLVFMARLYRIPPRQSRPIIRELLERFTLSDRWNARLSGLSRGMRQKVSLIRALVHQPSVLLLDEPTSALDPLSTRDVHAFIRERRAAGAALIVSTHNLPEAENLADRVAIMAFGRLRREGTREQLCQAPDSLERYSVTVDCPAPEAAYALVLGAPGVVDCAVTRVASERYRISYRTATWATTNAAITATLARDGLQVVALAPEPYTLEQVYLAAMEQATTCP